MTDGKGKNKTISFREDADTVEWLEKFAENELDTTKSELLRDHVERLEDDPMYRAFHTDLYNEDPDSFEEFLEETGEVDVKWIDQERVDYERLYEAMRGVHMHSEREHYEEAQEVIDDLEDDGYEREAIILDSFSSEYRP